MRSRAGGRIYGLGVAAALVATLALGACDEDSEPVASTEDAVDPDATVADTTVADAGPDAAADPDAVTEPDEPAQPVQICNPITQTNCAEGENCVFSMDTTLDTECIGSGAALYGEPCNTTEKCELGACLNISDTGQFCYQYCKTAAHCDNGGPCLNLRNTPWQVCELDVYESCNLLAQDCVDPTKDRLSVGGLVVKSGPLAHDSQPSQGGQYSGHGATHALQEVQG